MPPSSERILTTHAGSLPRPLELLSEVYAQETGAPVDAGKLGVDVRSAVNETVRKQLDAGVDIVNDGEVSKPSYATYVKDRLTGFGGESSLEDLVPVILDLSEFPDFAAERIPPIVESLANIRFTACDGPVSYTGHDALQTDIDNLKAAVAGAAPAGTFMSAASPGVISVFSPNRYYAGEEEYLTAIAEAMRAEYEAIHRAGFLLQLDCPDLAMTAPGAGSLQNFRKQIQLHIEVLNHAVANIPAEAMRIHVCWGNLEMPRTSDVELKDIIDIVLKGQARRYHADVFQWSSRPRMGRLRGRQATRGQVRAPGCARPNHQRG